MDGNNKKSLDDLVVQIDQMLQSESFYCSGITLEELPLVYRVNHGVELPFAAFGFEFFADFVRHLCTVHASTFNRVGDRIFSSKAPNRYGNWVLAESHVLSDRWERLEEAPDEVERRLERQSQREEQKNCVRILAPPEDTPVGPTYQEEEAATTILLEPTGPFEPFLPMPIPSVSVRRWKKVVKKKN